jgi:hypothetical protein
VKKAGVLVVTRLLFFVAFGYLDYPRLPADSSSASVCPFHLQDGRFTVSYLAFSGAYCALDAMIVLCLAERKVQEQGSFQPSYGGIISLER